MNIRRVVLELLRPGPPHNQLLSPLTEYIALCGDAPPESVRVPFEHYRILRRLQGLRPGRTPAEIEGSLTELREDVLRMLCGIRCLATALAEAHGDGAEVIELELVLSASELSLIPFELAFIPGSPTRELAHREVIVMRRSRRVPKARLTWQQRPRVLVVAASLPGFRPVPILEHVQGIREAIAPYLTYLDGKSESQQVLDELKKFVVVLPSASELSIQETIREAVYDDHPFTHVHVLAHGDEIAQDDGAETESGALREPQFGIVLHDSRATHKRDTLGGRRLFSALAGSDERCQRKLPQVVTLASCESGNIGGVVVPGASVAHDVHDGGVPVVVASQFPLSFPGSIVFVKRLYERLLAGDDPRCALRETRRSIHAAAKRRVGSVDWGAIVQYGALPQDLEAHVREARIRALRQQIDSAVSSVDDTVFPPPSGTVETAWRRANEGLEQLTPLRTDLGVDRYIARVNLRWAFILRSKNMPDEPTNPADRHALSLSVPMCLRSYRDGLRRYWAATKNPVSLVESLVGDFFLDEPLKVGHFVTAHTTCVASHPASASKDVARKLRRARVELWVLRPLVEDLPKKIAEWFDTVGVKSEDGVDHWFEEWYDAQFAEAPASDFEYYSGRRQIRRILSVANKRNEPPSAPQAESPDSGGNEPHPGQATSVADSRLSQVVKRARAIDVFLGKRGVPVRYSAIVDWIEDPDGGRRTVGT